MKEKSFKIRKNVIRETFNDESKIVSSVDAEELAIDKDIHQGGDIFITSKGEFIDLELQDEDFTEDELVKYVELAEGLYEEYGSKVSIYILCPRDINVCVKEFRIKSDADFTIKLACIDEDPCEAMLDYYKSKIRANEPLNKDDMDILESLPMRCKKEKRNYYRREIFKIMNRSHY